MAREPDEPGDFDGPDQVDPATITQDEWDYRAGLELLADASNALLPILQKRMNSPRYKKLAAALAFVQQECQEAGPRLVYGD